MISISNRIATTLGQGQFGSVSKGSWKSPDGRHDVAIKMLKPNATEDDRLKLLQEAAIMGQFTDKYVVKLLGVVTVGDPVSMYVCMYVYMYVCMYICMYVYIYNVCMSEFLISFEAWTKLAQKWLVCAPLGIHLQPINKELMLLVTI